jgi:hypothetical protein
MCTSSMNKTYATDQIVSKTRTEKMRGTGRRETRTPGTISALPSSFHSATLASICSLTSDLISPVSPVRGM